MFWSVMIVFALAVATLLPGLFAPAVRAAGDRPWGRMPRRWPIGLAVALALTFAAWCVPLAAAPESGTAQHGTAATEHAPAAAAPLLKAPLQKAPQAGQAEAVAEDKQPSVQPPANGPAKETPPPAGGAVSSGTAKPAASTVEDASAVKPEGESATEPSKAGEETSPPAAAAGQTPPSEKSKGRYPGWVVLLVVTGVLVLPFLLASLLASMWRVPEYQGKMSLIFFCLLATLAITVMGWPPKLGIDLKGGVTLVYEVKPEAGQLDESGSPDAENAKAGANGRKSRGPARLGTKDMEKLVGAISRRINPGGVKEVVIRPLGAGQIEIIIPEVDEAEVARYKKIISSVGTLEFRILANTQDHKSLIEDARQSDATKLYLLDDDGKPVRDERGQPVLRGWWVPVAKGQEGNFTSYPEIATRSRKHGDQELMEILVAKDEFDVNGGYLVNARAGTDEMGRPSVNFTFNDKGGQLFAGLTSDNLPDKVTNFSRKLGIVLDGYLYSAPAIKSTIHKRGEITGSFTKEEVKNLVDVLNAGSLPTALSEKPISQLATGPQLGRDTIRRGKIAIGSSMLVVLLFMWVYYRFAGFVACLAMLMNLVLILGVMITVKAAFTLPGLAGLVLTVGMAVDANVLIFERIREELDRQATLRMAIRNGFARATTTIVDANLTTLITGIVLYAIGTDQVRGFAVTLILGVTLSMFTAIYCARVVFDIAEKKRWLTEMHMMRILRGSNIDFIGARRLAGGISLAVIVVGLVGVVARGKGLLDIDFTGGVSVQTVFTEAQDVGQIRRDLAALPDLAVSDVQIPGEPPHRRFVVNTSSPPDEAAEAYLQEIKDRIAKIYGDKLAHYTLTFSSEAESPGTGQPDAPQPGAAQSSRRDDLPSRQLFAAADDAAILLAQADSGDTPPPANPPAQGETAEKAPPAAKPGETAPTAAKPGETAKTAPPAAEPGETETAGKPPTPASPSTLAWELDFGTHKLSYKGLRDDINEQMNALGSLAEFELANEAFAREQDEERGYTHWTATIQLPPDEARKVLEAVKSKLEKTPYFPSSNTIGGRVAGDTRVKAIAALLASLVCIVGYIWVRFQRVMFGLAAVVALVHDVLITLGVIALSYWLAPFLRVLLIDEFKIGLSVLAAFLTIIGYSLNDTIVVFDRIREVRGKAPRLTSEMINTSINQTLSRTLLTSFTTLLVVVVLYMFGGQGIHAFAFSLVIGVLVGTYSSIFVASPVLLWMADASARAKTARR